MLLGLGALVLAYWPRGPLWTVNEENIVGFDENQGVLYTICRKDGTVELRTRHLDKGTQVNSRPISLPPGRDGSKVSWPLALSKGRQFLIAVSETEPEFHVFRLPSQLEVLLDTKEKYGRAPLSLGFSQDGHALLLKFIDSESDVIAIWDLDSGNSRAIELSHRLPVAMTGFTTSCLPQETLQLTADHRYLATTVIGGPTVLCDLVKSEIVLRLDEKAMPRFSADGKTLLFLSIGQNEQEAIRYRLIQGKWQPLDTLQLPFLKDEYFVQWGDDCFVTAWDEYEENSWWKQVPESWQPWLEIIRPLDLVHLRFWDIATGQMKPELNLTLPWQSAPGFRFLPNAYRGNETTISSDARYVVHQEQKRLSIWETNPRRPLTSWLIIVGVVALNIWLAWPRKLQTA
jgi:hypothetical protein